MLFLALRRLVSSAMQGRAGEAVIMESGSEFLQSLAVIVLAAFAFAYAGGLLRVPSIVAYLAAGLAIGPLLGLSMQNHSVSLISEMGIALMLFLVGLEMSIDKIRDIGAVALVAGIGQVLFTAAGGYVLCALLGFAPMDAVFLSVALTFSSTVVVVKLLDEKREINALYGRIAVGIFLVQDMVVIVILTLLAGLGRAGEANPASLARETVMAFAGMAVLLVGILATSKQILPRLFSWASNSPQTLVIWSLAWCFLSVVAAKGLGLSLEIGAFLAGVGLAQLRYNKDLHRRVHPLMNFMLAVFFVSLGMQADFRSVADNLWPAFVLAAFVLIGNPFIFIVIIRLMGYRMNTAFLSGVTVAQISEFSFVFVALGMANGLVGESILSVTTLVGFVTISISAYMILYNHQMLAFCERYHLLNWLDFGPIRETDDHKTSKHFSDHIIVVGMNSLGRRIATALSAQGELVLAVDTDPRKLADLPCKTLLGSIEYLGTLEEAGLDCARLLVSALQIEETNELLAYRCECAGVPCSVVAVDINHMDELLGMGVDYLMVPKVDGIKMQNRKLHEMGVLTK